MLPHSGHTRREDSEGLRQGGENRRRENRGRMRWLRGKGRGLAVPVLCLCFFLLFSLAEGSPLLVHSVTFSGNRRVSSERLRKLVWTRKGVEFSLEKVREDVKKLFSTGYFRDVKVDVQYSEEGVDVTFLLEEKPVVLRVVVTGNDEVKTEEIEKVLTIKENDYFSSEKVKESEEKLRELYENNGFFDVKIRTKVIEREGNRREVRFSITEGEKRKIEKIVFRGNNYFTDDELKDRIQTSEKGFFSFITGSGTFKKDVFENDLKILEVLYLDNGFLDVKVEGPFFRKTEEGLILEVKVHEGIQYRVGDISLQGDGAGEAEKLREKFSLKKYMVFSREKMVRDILMMTRKLQDEGFADATVIPRYQRRRGEPVADITYIVEKGKKYRFGLVNVHGNTKTLDKVIRRNLEVEEGALYTATGLEESRKNLLRLGYFKDVKVTTSKGKEEDELDVNVEVEEAPTGSISGGFGFSSVDKFFGVVNLSENNLFGRGWKLNLNSQFGSRRVIFDLGFTDPAFLDSDFTLRLNAYNTDVEYDEFTRKAKGGRVGFSYPLSKYVSTGLSLRIDQVKIQDVQTDVENSVLLEEALKGAQITHSITWDITRDTRNSFINPTEGSRQSFSVEYAGGILGGESDFVKYFIEDRTYVPVLGSSTYGFRFLWGHTVSTVGGRVPLFERFFLGGPYTIRGFEARSITPVDRNTGEEIGGNKELVVNNELIIPLYEEIGLKWVFFFDAGNTWRQGDYPRNLGDLRYGAGFGIRWYSPMGPLRFEWGFNLDPKEGEPKRVVEFTIGTSF
ncbi:MAG: outer membrane protein assembly factor BamA [Deltaproteobacteria bacterium]|nr:MAG: outer membrane protein assembly factor BamA [Deltaproteobacteria bacterium]